MATNKKRIVTIEKTKKGKPAPKKASSTTKKKISTKKKFQSNLP